MPARKTSAAPSRIWTFGGGHVDARDVALRRAAQPLLLDELGRAHRYYNSLVEIERKRREKYREIRAAFDERVDGAQREFDKIREKLDNIRTEIKARRQRDRKRTKCPELQARIEALKVERDAAKSGLKDARAAFAKAIAAPNELRKQRIEELKEQTGTSGPRAVEKFNAQALSEMLEDPNVSDIWKAVARADADANAAVKALRTSRGELGETYLLVEKSIEAAKSGRADPQFAAWRHRGRVGVQITGRTTMADIFAGRCPKLQIVAPPEGTWAGSRAYRRKHARTTLRIRCSRTGFVELPVTIDREPPRDALVKWAWIKCRRVGTLWEFALQLTLQSESLRRPVASSARGTVAINMGWRDLGDRQRVGMCVDTLGSIFELSVPTAFVRGPIEYSSGLRSILDRSFDTARADLTAWLKSHEHPDWLREATKHMHAWKNHGRLVALIHRWAHERFPGDEAIWQRFEAQWDPATGEAGWRHRSRHLYQWEASQREKALRRRKDLYRNIARELADRYETIVLGNIDYRKLARLPAAEADNELHEHARRGRTIAALSELVGCMQSACGERVVRINAANVTTDCHVCGHRHARPEALVHTCEACGSTSDQDVRAAYNLLHRHDPDRERSWRAKNPAPARHAEPLRNLSPLRTSNMNTDINRRNRSQNGAEAAE